MTKTEHTNDLWELGSFSASTGETVQWVRVGDDKRAVAVHEHGGVIGRAKARASRIVACMNAWPDLLAVAERLATNGECTCADGGNGFACDVCETRAALEKANATA